MSVEEYWIGKDINYRTIWKDYEGGLGYINTVNSQKLHVLRIELPNFHQRNHSTTTRRYIKPLKGTSTILRRLL
jgi:hypothetical protein